MGILKKLELEAAVGSLLDCAGKELLAMDEAAKIGDKDRATRLDKSASHHIDRAGEILLELDRLES